MIVDYLKELKDKRLRFIHKLYEESGGDELHIANEQDISKAVNLSEEEVSTVSRYLLGEGLIEYRALGGFIGITHHGVVEVEHALSEPDQPSHYSPTVTSNNIRHLEESQIQQDTIDSAQQEAFEASNQKQLLEFIELLKDKLPELEISAADKSEIEADTTTINAQIKSSRPKTGIIKECLSSIKIILEGMSETVVVYELLKNLPGLL